MESLFDLIDEIKDEENDDVSFISEFVNRVNGGENINIKNNYGDPLITVAASSGSYDIFNSLVKKGAKLNGIDKLMRDAARGGNVEIVKTLLDAGLSISYWALAWASEEGHLGVVKLFIESGIDVNHQENIVVEGMIDIETKSDTMLSSAASTISSYEGSKQVNKKIDTINYLLDNGADINLHGKFGNIALHRAATDRNVEIVKLLLKKGADIKAKNDKGARPFTYADSKDKKVKALIK